MNGDTVDRSEGIKKRGRPPKGVRRYQVTLSKANAEKAKSMESNFSGLLDRLLANWLAENDSNT